MTGFFSYAKQRAFCNSGTVRDNLLQADPNADDEEILRVIETACAQDLLQDEGMDRKVTKEGGNLSGGQKQRMSLAKALLRKAPVCVLDDCFSALDAATEKNILENLRTRYPGRTFFMVSQKVRSLKSCDRILLMRKGRIEAVGSHRELYRTSEVYREICESQQMDDPGKEETV